MVYAGLALDQQRVWKSLTLTCSNETVRFILSLSAADTSSTLYTKYTTFMPTTNYINAQAGAVSKLKAETRVREGIYTGKPLNGYCKVPWTDIHQVDEAKRA